jgi:hypothetical protein
MSVLRNGEKRPDPTQPVFGVPGSRLTFFLRSTPQPHFILSSAVGGNQEGRVRAIPPVERPENELGSRIIKSKRGTGLTITLDVVVAGIATITPNLGSPSPGGVLLETVIAGQGSLAAGFVTSLALDVDVTGSASVAPAMSGGHFAGELNLDPEASTGLTLTPETSDPESLTPETGDSLTLTPET